MATPNQQAAGELQRAFEVARVALLRPNSVASIVRILEVLQERVTTLLYASPAAPVAEPSMINGLTEAETSATASVAGPVHKDLRKRIKDVLCLILEESEEYDFADGLGVGIPQRVFDAVQGLHEDLVVENAWDRFNAVLDKPDPSASASVAACETCGGKGMIGGFVNAMNGYDGEPCPDCNAPAAPAGELVAVGRVTALVNSNYIEWLPHSEQPLFEGDELCSAKAAQSLIAERDRKIAELEKLNTELHDLVYSKSGIAFTVHNDAVFIDGIGELPIGTLSQLADSARDAERLGTALSAIIKAWYEGRLVCDAVKSEGYVTALIREGDASLLSIAASQGKEGKK